MFHAKHLLILTVFASPSFASFSVVTPYVEIQNLTGSEIHHLYLSQEAVLGWENDVLDEEILGHGEMMRVNIHGYDSPLFDIRVIDQDGDDYQKFNVHVSNQVIIFTPADRIK